MRVLIRACGRCGVNFHPLDEGRAVAIAKPQLLPLDLHPDFHPLDEGVVGEILGTGEIVWLLSSHPGLFFEFGMTTWGDGSVVYRNWFKTRLREGTHRRYLLGQEYSWAYSEGIFLEDCERGPRGSHLAYFGLTDYACGQLPCLYLGFNEIFPQYGNIQRLDL